MFIEDGSLQYIEADAQDVLAVFRSTATQMIAHGRREKQPCEAFVCVVQEGIASTAYVALSMLKSKSFAIYVPEKKPHDKESSDATVQEALEFAEGFGFEMQSVNLNYSKALREVVLNDLRVVRSGGGGKRVSQKKVSGEKSSKAAPAPSGKGSDEKADSMEKTVGSHAISENEAVSLESMNKTVLSPGSHGEINPAASKEMARKESADPVLVDDSGIIAIRAEKERLKEERKRVEKETNEELAVLHTEIASITREIQSLSAERQLKTESAKAEIDRLSKAKAAERKALGDELASFYRKIGELKEEIKAQEDTYSQQIREASQEIEKLSAEKVERENRSRAELAALKSEMKRLLEERESAEKEREKEKDLLRLDIERLSAQEIVDEDFDALKAELARLVSEKDAAQKAFLGESSNLHEQILRLRDELQQIEEGGKKDLSLLRSQREALNQQKSSVELEMGKEVANLRKELEFLRGEKAASEEAVSAEISALLAEKERLVEEKERRNQESYSRIQQLKNDTCLLEEEIEKVQQMRTVTLSALRGDMERLTVQKESMEKASAEEQSALRDSVRKLEEEIAAQGQVSKRQLDKLRREVERLTEQKRTELEASSAEISLLTAQIARLQKECAETVENAMSEGGAIKAEIVRLTAELEDGKEKASAQLKVLREEAERLSQMRAEAEASSAAEVEAARDMVSRLASEVEELEREKTEKIAALSLDAERLVREREAAEQRAGAAVSAAREEIERVASELLHSGNAIMERISSTHAEILGRWEMLPEIMLFERSPENLKKEKTCRQDESGRVANVVSPENEQIVQGKTVELCGTDTRDSIPLNVGEEFPGMVGEKASTAVAGHLHGAPERETAVPTEDSSKVCLEDEGAAEGESGEISLHETVFPDALYEEATDGTVSAAIDSSDPFAFLHCGDTQEGAFSRVSLTKAPSSGLPVRFAVDKSLSAVEYRSPKEIAEIYQSLNRTRVAMEDHTTITCDAYLCGIASGGRYSVYIALYLVDTEGVLVYCPEVQPEDSDAFARTLRDGMEFVEIVGFMMDPVDLGVNEAQRVKSLQKIPVLRKVSSREPACVR